MNIWKFCQQQLSGNYRVVLMVIMETKGSSPGKVGFKMAVSSGGKLNGSVGGGSAEYAAVEHAKLMMKKKEAEPELKKQVHSDKAGEDSSGMICSGEQTIIMMPLSQDDSIIIDQLADSTEKYRVGVLSLSPMGMDLMKGKNLSAQYKTNVNSENDWQYNESIGLRHLVSIFGGGHVSVELSKIMQMLGFYVKVYDNRTDISTMENNQHAHEKHVIDFAKAGQYVDNDLDTYVVIMTVGHLHDLEVLEQMVGKEVKYLGMMGSKSKVSTIHRLLKEKGFAEKDIQRIHMPIGEPIHSHTPAEIAISISAQIIKIKNQPE